MIPVTVNIKDNDVYFQVGDDKVVYKTQVNNFEKETGLTIQNIAFPIQSENIFYLNLADFGETHSCGTVFNNILLELNRNEVENVLLIVDFERVTEVSTSFFNTYTKLLLESKNKIIGINMNVQITNDFGYFIKENILEAEE